MFILVIEYIEEALDDSIIGPNSHFTDEITFDDYEHALMARDFWDQNYFVKSLHIEEF